MARKEQSNVKQMDDEVVRCFVHPASGREVTTPQERREVAERWCAGDYEYHHAIAQKHGLLPIALLIAALYDIEHPLIVSGRGMFCNSIEAAIIITNVMFKKQTVAQPVEPNSLHRQLVERIK